MTFKTLILPGNGMKAIYTLGALESLGEAGKLNDIENYIGVSSGSILSALLIMGMRPIEILGRILNKSLFQKVGRISMMGIINGDPIFKFDPIENELRAVFVDYIGKVPTFSEFYERTEKTFVCLGYDAMNHQTLYFSKETFPDLSVLQAIQASCAFPLLFHAVAIDGHYLVDGGVGCNYPLTWAEQNFPGPFLSVHIKTKFKTVDETTPRLTALKELVGYIIQRPDFHELEKNRSKMTIVELQIDQIHYFDFSNRDQVYITQFDTGYHLTQTDV